MFLSFKFSLISFSHCCSHIQVAAISGDARRALEICRRAAELTDFRIKKLASPPNNFSEGR